MFGKTWKQSKEEREWKEIRESFPVASIIFLVAWVALYIVIKNLI
jgi:hypothetical protein